MTYSSEVLVDSPLVYWRLGESSGTSLADSSGNGRTATLTSGTLGASGALSGDSDTAITNPLAEIADAAWMDVTSITIEAWVKFNSTTGGDQAIVSRYGSDGFFWMLRRNSSLNIVGNVATASLTSPGTIANGSWVHVVVTYGPSATNNGNLYINGALVAQDTGNTLTTGTRKIQIGQYSDSSGTNVAGTVDEVAIYGSVLSATRIAAHYAAATGAVSTVTGTLDAALPPLSSTMAGTSTAPTVTGVLGATLPGLAASFVDGAVAGTLAASLPALSSYAEGTSQELDGGVGFAEELPDDDLPPADVPDPSRLIRTSAWSVPPIELDDRGQPTAAWRQSAVEFRGTWGAYELYVGGQNVTTFRDLPVQIGTRQHADPFGYAALEVAIPGVTPWETPLWGTGDLSWMSDWAPVVLRLVAEAGVSSVLWRGFVGSVSPEATGLRLTCAGEARGRLDFDKKTVRPFMFRKDIGVMLYDLARRPGLRITPTLGIETGIILDERSRAQGTLLECIDEICALSQRSDGETVTFTPTGPNGNIYEMHYRDSETVHYTVHAGAYGIQPSLQSNLVDRPTTLYGVGRESDGGVWANLKAPGLFESAPPAFPGTLSPGDVGEDVNTLKARLDGVGLLDRADALGEYGFGPAMQDAVEVVQERLGHAVTGVVDEATWNACYDIDITGTSLSNAHQEPLDELDSVRRYLTTPSGAIAGPNPDYVAERPRVAEMTDYGVYTKRQARRRAKRSRQRRAQGKAWAGTLRLNTDLFLGDHHHGDADPVVVSRFESLAGKNIMLRGWDGDVLLHVAGDDTGATLSVSTMGLPLLEVRQIIERNQEGRQNPAKTFKRQHRGVELGGIGEWWSEIGGEITVRQALQGGKWNVLDPVIAGDMGTLAKVALELDTAAEFACALFAVPVNDAWVNNNLPNPFDTVGRLRNLRVTHKGTGYEHAPTVSFSGGGGSGAAAKAHVSDGHVVGIEWTSRGTGYTSAPTVSLSGGGGSGADAAVGIGGIGSKAWASDEVRDMADRRRILLGAWGDAEDPCGYGPNGHKADGDDLDGTFADAAGIPYRTFASDDINNGKRGALYWAVYVKTDNAVSPQRCVWPNPEVGM